MESSGFAAKLGMVLKAVSVNRARLAADLEVDKSLVGKWLSGAVTPSTHNLHRLTQLVATHRPGFTPLDWDRSLESLAERLGVEAAETREAPDERFGDWLPHALLEEGAATTRQRGFAYTGFWRSTRPAPEMPGRFLHDVTMMWIGPNGMLMQKLGLGGFSLKGWCLPLRNQLFGMSAHEASGLLVFSVFNGVPRQKAEVIDGLTLSCLMDAGGSPVAGACVLERIGDLSGDADADQLRFKTLLREPPLAPEGSIPSHIVEHLTGPPAVSEDALLLLHFGRSMARGVPFGYRAEAIVTSPERAGEVVRPAFGRPTG